MALSTIGTGGIADSAISTAKIAADAVTAAKIDDDGTGFTFGDLTVAGAVVGDGFTSVDKLKLDGSSVATVTVNSAVSASATIAVDGVAGTIVVGMVVNVSDISVRSISDAASQTAISTDDSLTITAVASQTSFTVSEAVTIADNVVLILTADESGGFVLDASAASTDVGEEILFEDATGDVSAFLKDGIPYAIKSGSVLQVVEGGRTTRVTHNSSTYTDVGVSATITPTNSTSKILVTLTGTLGNAAASNLTLLRLFRGSIEIGSGTGAGKTISFIIASREVESRLTIVICLNSTVSQLEEDILEVYPDSLIHNNFKKGQEFDRTKFNYLLLNYEKFQQGYTEERFQDLNKNNLVDFIVLDEIHNAKQRDKKESLRRAAVMRLIGRSAEMNPNFHLLGMSATPVINNLIEAKSLLQLITGKEYDDIGTRGTITNALKVFNQLLLNGIRYIPKYNIILKENLV